jgi:hypothetical protein
MKIACAGHRSMQAAQPEQAVAIISGTKAPPTRGLNRIA